MNRDFANGYFLAMERAITLGRTLEGDCGFIENEIINDSDFIEAESIVMGPPRAAADPGEE